MALSPQHPLADHKQIAPRQLLQYPYFSREAGSGTREFTDLYLRRCGIDPQDLIIEMELGSPESLKAVVAVGIGFAIMPRVAIEKEKRLGELVAVPLTPRLIRTLSLVYPKEKFRSRLVNAFIEFAIGRLKGPRL